MDVFDLPAVEALIRTALAEDLGRGDLTTRLTVEAGTRAAAEITAKQECVVAGLPLLDRVYGCLAGGRVGVDRKLSDGTRVAGGEPVASLAGPAADLLAGERVALNFVQHLSGIATLTRRFADAVAGTAARIVDTRKTVPGFRALAKYAVRTGGGGNHRGGLDDGVLIKDNHIAAAGGLEAAVTRARGAVPHGLKIEVECRCRAEVEEALRAGADILLLDNMSVDETAAAVRLARGRAVTEASGNVTLGNVRAVAETGVDLISVGALTHSAPAVDLSMHVAIV